MRGKHLDIFTFTGITKTFVCLNICFGIEMLSPINFFTALNQRNKSNITAYLITSLGIWKFVPHQVDFIPQSKAEWDI